MYKHERRLNEQVAAVAAAASAAVAAAAAAAAEAEVGTRVRSTVILLPKFTCNT